jgi:Tfp pilus assembly protein PilO
MSRIQILLSAVVAILLIAVFYVLLFAPSREQVAELEEQIAAELVQQTQLQAEIGRLRAVRERAPEVEAELAAAEAIIPRDANLPAALRQLQLAADESGIILESVTTTRPVSLEEGVTDLSAIEINVQLYGGYFQAVDFLRRVEDPQITPRGLDWANAAITYDEDEYPALNIVLSGELYAVIASPPPPETEAPVDGDTADADEGAEDVTGEDAGDGEDVS